MKPYTSQSAILVALLAVAAGANAILVQPYNYMLDDSAMLSAGSQVAQADAGSLSPFYNDQSGSSEQSADKDIVSIIGDSLARLRYSRLLDNPEDGSAHSGHLSQEMADLLQSEQQHQNQKDGSGAQEAASQQQQQQTLSSSVANMLMNVAQAAVASSESDSVGQQQDGQRPTGNNGEPSLTARGSIMELDTSPATGSGPSKADLKSGPIQWFNPKETIPVLKISSMGK